MSLHEESNNNSSGHFDQHDQNDQDDNGEVELPRLEDSRASAAGLLQLPPPDLLAVLQGWTAGDSARKRNPLLSSTMVQESFAGGGTSGVEQDWLTASSIHLANSRDSASGLLNDRLNNANIGLLLDNNASVAAALIDSDARATPPSPPASPPPPPAAAVERNSDAATSKDAASIRSGSTEDGAAVRLKKASEASPRLRILANDGSGEEGEGEGESVEESSYCHGPQADKQQQQQHPEQLLQQPRQQQQRAVGLLQVCRLSLEVLSESGLLASEALRWLTPELLCDKLCDRLARPEAPPASRLLRQRRQRQLPRRQHPLGEGGELEEDASIESSSASADNASSSVLSSSTSSLSAAATDTPDGRVRLWLTSAPVEPSASGRRNLLLAVPPPPWLPRPRQANYSV